jgi:hypothetical protein
MNAEEFADIKFRVDCEEILLSRNGGKSEIKGPGQIWQKEDGGIEYKFFTDQSGRDAYYTFLSEFIPGIARSGQESYFNLDGQVYTGPVWGASHIIPQGISGGEKGGGVVTGKLREIKNLSSYPADSQRDCVILRFRGLLEFPWNESTVTKTLVGGAERKVSSFFNVARFEAAGWTFEVHHSGAHTVLDVRLPKGQLKSSTPSCLHESLQFVLGQQLALLCVQIYSEGQLLTSLRSPKNGNGKMPPPILFNQIKNKSEVLNLFVKYFQAIHASHKPGIDLVSCHIGNVIESSAASLETHILALSVAVEGLLKIYHKSVNGPHEPKTLRRYLQRKDFLDPFVSRHQLDPSIAAAWIELRDLVAHTGSLREVDVNDVAHKKYVIIYLLYSVVFELIEYGGLRTDYSKIGRKNIIWPISKGGTV